MSEADSLSAAVRSLASHPTSRRGFLAFAALAGASAGLTACSGGGSSYDDAKTLTFTFWGNGPEKTAVTEAVKSFAKSKGLSGRAQNIPVDNYETKINTLVAGSNVPDAGYINPGSAMRYGGQGRLVNAEEYPDFDQFLPNAVHYYAPGKAITQTNAEVYGLWYDKKALRDVGVESLPVTSDTAMKWDDFIALADKLTVDSNGKHPSDSGFDPAHVERYGFGSPTWLAPYSVLLKANGVDMFDEAGKRCFFDTDDAVQVMQAINDMIFEHRVSPTNAQMSEIGATHTQFANKRVAMNLDGQWTLMDLNPLRKKGTVEYDVGVSPTFGDGAWAASMGAATGAFARSNNKKDAIGLLMYLSDPTKVPIYAQGLWMPVLEKYYTDEKLRTAWMDNDDHPAGYRSAVADLARSDRSFAYPDFRIKNWPAIDSAIAGFLTKFTSQKADVRPLCKQLAEAVNPLLQGAYTGKK
jgi:multiple sugar transport system substrate-binding protein